MANNSDFDFDRTVARIVEILLADNKAVVLSTTDVDPETLREAATEKIGNDIELKILTKDLNVFNGNKDLYSYQVTAEVIIWLFAFPPILTDTIQAVPLDLTFTENVSEFRHEQKDDFLTNQPD